MASIFAEAPDQARLGSLLPKAASPSKTPSVQGSPRSPPRSPSPSTPPGSPRGRVVGTPTTPDTGASDATVLRLGSAARNFEALEGSSSEDDSMEDAAESPVLAAPALDVRVASVLDKLPKGDTCRVVLRLLLAGQDFRMPTPLPTGVSPKAVMLSWLEQLLGPHLTQKARGYLKKRNKAGEVFRAVLKSYTRGQVRLEPQRVCELFLKGRSRTGCFMNYQRSPEFCKLIRRHDLQLPLPEGIRACRAHAEVLRGQAEAAE